MKRKFIFMFLILFVLSACNNKTILENDSYTTSKAKGSIGEFALLSPLNNESSTSIPKFTWESAPNASTYTLEIASTDNFLNDGFDDAYIKKTGITTTSYSINANIKAKNQTYYWRVTACNSDSTKLPSNSYGSFYYQAQLQDEIPVSLEYSDEWTVHKEGSAASVNVDNNNFFSNDMPSLVVSFEKEDTNRGISSSDGWMVITHSVEKEFYGVDAFYFDFYYCGQDSDIYIRVVDEDNEYWNAQIKLANNVKQKIVIKFSDFTLRTKGGTPINNREFDYNFIKSFELVFEKTFGDGVCYVSDLKACKYEDYQDMFIQKVDFNEFDNDDYLYEAYNFNKEVLDNGSTLSMSFNTNIYGYGFLKVKVDKYLVAGDAFKLKINYTGSNSKANFIFRIIEEDKDRWVYKEAISNLPEDGIIYIPFKAFTLSEYNGNGSREFYNIKQLQFGIENNSMIAGSLKWSDIEIVTMADEIENYQKGTISQDGLIDNFDSYKTSTEIFNSWQTSTSNKDESMSINTMYAYSEYGNALKTTYKTDMGPAYYGLYFDGIAGFDSLSIDLLDNSVLNDLFSYLPNAKAKAIISLYVSDGSEYKYVIESLNSCWTRYNIKFSDFELVGIKFESTVELLSENIRGLQIGFQYFYYTKQGIASPQYMPNQDIYIDNVKLTNSSETSTSLIEKHIEFKDGENPVYVIDDFEGDLNNWFKEDGISLSNNTVSGTKSLEFSIDALEEKTLRVNVDFDLECVAQAIKFKALSSTENLKIKIYSIYSGEQYIFTTEINSLDSSWNEYTIGFDYFTKELGSGNIFLSSRIVKNIYAIEFIVNNESNNDIKVYFDDVSLTQDEYSSNLKTLIGE